MQQELGKRGAQDYPPLSEATKRKVAAFMTPHGGAGPRSSKAGGKKAVVQYAGASGVMRTRQTCRRAAVPAEEELLARLAALRSSAPGPGGYGSGSHGLSQAGEQGEG